MLKEQTLQVMILTQQFYREQLEKKQSKTIKQVDFAEVCHF